MADLVVIEQVGETVVIQEVAPASLVDVVTPGPQGPSATLAVGTVTTGAAGSQAAVTNSGTPTAAVLDFTIPKGDKGDTGDITPELQALADAAADSADAAAASETAAGLSETAAGNYATAAGNSATAAGLSETAAGNYATQAGNSATAASASETAAHNSELAAAQSVIDAANASRLTMGTVTQVAPGGAPTATITGAPGSQVLNLGLVTGDKGDKGDQGDIGPSTTFTGATPPASPQPGWKWIDPDSGIEYTWFDDGDSAQWVETGAGGAVINGGGGGGTTALVVSDVADDATYYYYGGLLGTAWQINRYAKADITKTTATATNNATYADLATAWPDRATLTYA